MWLQVVNITQYYYMTFADRFSGPVRAIGQVRLLCVGLIISKPNDLWRDLTCSSFTFRGQHHTSKFKIIGGKKYSANAGTANRDWKADLSLEL